MFRVALAFGLEKKSTIERPALVALYTFSRDCFTNPKTADPEPTAHLHPSLKNI